MVTIWNLPRIEIQSLRKIEETRPTALITGTTAWNIAGSLFLLVWVTFWTLGGLFAAGVVLWNLFGSERLFVTEGMLVHSVGFGPFRRKRIYPLDEVGDFRVDTRGDPATNAIPLGSIGYRAGGARHTFGIGMTRAEAEASLAAIRRALPFPDGGDFPPPPAADT